MLVVPAAAVEVVAATPHWKRKFNRGWLNFLLGIFLSISGTKDAICGTTDLVCDTTDLVCGTTDLVCDTTDLVCDTTELVCGTTDLVCSTRKSSIITIYKAIVNTFWHTFSVQMVSIYKVEAGIIRD